ncbi:hypothetical protein B0H14DRAFT_57186 [Mycena olivaceomarginata]|nr:hypothetical protein B0H14DRAFT_57186 [Mycena olivaceomarginata]
MFVCALPRTRRPHDAAVSGRWWGRCCIKFGTFHFMLLLSLIISPLSSSPFFSCHPIMSSIRYLHTLSFLFYCYYSCFRTWLSFVVLSPSAPNLSFCFPSLTSLQTLPRIRPQTLARCDIHLGSTIHASKHLSHACGVDLGPCFALLGQDHALDPTQIRPPSLKTTASPTPPPGVWRPPHVSRFLRDLAHRRRAELQDIGGQRGEAAMGVLFSRIVRDPLVPPVALLYFFDVSPSCRSNAASSQHLRAQSLSPRRPGCRTLQRRTQTGGSRAGRPPFLDTRSYRPSSKITVSPTRRTVHDQSALYYALVAFIFDAPVPPRRTGFSPHIPSSPYDTWLLPPLPCLQRPAHVIPACRHLRVSVKLGLSAEHSGMLVPPGARTTSACEPGSIAPHRRTV